MGEIVVKDEAPAVNVDKTTGGRALIAGPLVTNRMDVFANNEGYGGGMSSRFNFLFASDGSGSFTDIATDLGLLDSTQTGRGTAILDSNGDGLLDIGYGNWNGPHRLFIQEKDANGCSKFVDKAPSTMAIHSPIRTVIVADFDSDGQLELVISHGESAAQPLSYFRPTGGNGHHRLRVLPLTIQGAPARGATVHLRAGDRTQVRVIDAGSGYLCQMEPVAHFGLGSLTEVDSITVTWPDGASHTITSPLVDQTHRVSRPSGL